MDKRKCEIRAMLREALAPFARQLKGRRVFLFGSRAEGTARGRSDFDVGVIGDAPLPIRTFLAIEDAFDDLPTLYRIDWVDFNRVSPIFRERAMKRVVTLYE